MEIKIPFTNKTISLSTKVTDDTFYSLEDKATLNLLGFDNFSGTAVKAQQTFLDEGYAQNSIVYSIISKISQCGAEIPKVLVRKDDPEGTPIESGEVYDLLKRPAKYQGEWLSQHDYFEYCLTMLLATGNLYQMGVSSTGFGDSWEYVDILPSGRTYPIEPVSYLDPAAGYRFEDKQVELYFEYDDVLHTKFIDPSSFGLNHLTGLSPLQAATFALTGSTDINKAISVMVKNQGVRGILTNDGNRILDGDQARKLKNSVNDKIRGVDKYNSVHVTSASLKYQQMGVSANDLRIIESGVLTDRQICNAFNVSSRLFNDPENSTYNNMKEARKDFYENAVISTTNKIIQDINRRWIPQFDDRLMWKLDTSSVEALQADQKEEAEKDKAYIDGIEKVINLPISQEGKINLLVSTFGMSEEMAREVSNTQNNGLTE